MSADDILSPELIADAASIDLPARTTHELRVQLAELLIAGRLYAYDDTFWRAVGGSFEAPSVISVCSFTEAATSPRTDKNNRVTSLRRWT